MYLIYYDDMICYKYHNIITTSIIYHIIRPSYDIYLYIILWSLIYNIGFKYSYIYVKYIYTINKQIIITW